MSKRSMVMALLVLAGVTGATKAEAAQGCATVSFSGVPGTISYDPFSTADQTFSFTATITPVSNGDNSVRLITVDQQSGLPTKVGTSGPQYQVLLSGTNIAFPSGNHAGAQTTPTTSTAGGGNNASYVQPLTLVIRADQTQTLTSGSFSETLGYSMQCYHPNNGNTGNTPGNEDNTTTGGPTINVTVASSARFTTASAQNIDFGNFTQTTAKATVYIQSTSNYDVNVATANASRLILAGAVSPYPANSVIPYSMTFAGSAISSSAPLTNRPRVGFTAAPFDLVLDTGTLPSGKLSGGYSDTITLTLVPK